MKRGFLIKHILLSWICFLFCNQVAKGDERKLTETGESNKYLFTEQGWDVLSLILWGATILLGFTFFIYRRLNPGTMKAPREETREQLQPAELQTNAATKEEWVLVVKSIKYFEDLHKFWSELNYQELKKRLSLTKYYHWRALNYVSKIQKTRSIVEQISLQSVNISSIERDSKGHISGFGVTFEATLDEKRIVKGSSSLHRIEIREDWYFTATGNGDFILRHKQILD